MTQAQPEPSMEEILASIRRIISDDGDEETAISAAKSAPGSGRAAPPPGPRPRPTPVAAATPTTAQTHTTPSTRPTAVRREETTTTEDDRARTHLKTEDVEMIKKSMVETDVVVDEVAATAAARAFQNLSQTVRVSAKGEGRTLEDIVVEIIRPLVKQWLDENLAQIVEAKVEAEVERVARLRR